MEAGSWEARYDDLTNFPDIVVRCIDKGMKFDGRDVLDKFLAAAFSVRHYEAFQSFAKIFPIEYGIRYERLVSQLRPNRNTPTLSCFLN